ncbi:MAG: metallophosphoesterase [Clostridia bacterium]|nr:metallophosphoesterase [Clostridia bacterium]
MKRNLTKTLLVFILAAVFGVGAFFALSPVTADAASDEPIMRIALFSDLHVEYGLQKNEKPMRPATAKSVQYAKELTDNKGFDVVLVGGDMSGGRGYWKNQAAVTRTKNSIYETLAKASKDGKVLFVSGNHDADPSLIVKTPAGGDFSGDYGNIMKSKVGKFVSALYADDVKKGLSPYNELLCYRYTINGMEFIGLNTPYLGVEGNESLCAEQTAWLTAEMKKIGKSKTVFLLCHYPKTSIGTMDTPAKTSASQCQVDLNKLFSQYPNIIYCYGHVHSGNLYWAKNNTSELVKPEGKSTQVAKGIFSNTGIVAAHMGSMAYYENTLQPGSLSIEDPVVCQFVAVDVYANRISFRVHNTGEQTPPGGKREIGALTIARNMAAQFGLPETEGVLDSVNSNKPATNTLTLTLTGDSPDKTSDVTDSVDTPITDSGSVSDVPSAPVNPSTGGDVNVPSNVPSEEIPVVPPEDVEDREDTDTTTSGTDDGDVVKKGSAGTVLIIVLCVVGVIVIGAGVAVAVLVKKKK